MSLFINLYSFKTSLFRPHQNYRFFTHFSRKLFCTKTNNDQINIKNDMKSDDKVSHHHSNYGLYHTPGHDPDSRDHLWKDGTRKVEYTSDAFHFDEMWQNTPPQKFIYVNNQKMVLGEPTRPMEQLYCQSQKNLPFWSRNRLNIWSNSSLILKAEFLFFWVPTAIIWSLTIPAFAMIYMMDEAIFTTMTVKVIGRQWYWVYEVESPPQTDDE